MDPTMHDTPETVSAETIAAWDMEDFRDWAAWLGWAEFSTATF